jgi:predicted ATPase/DNA-binding winged helix-turn-helix (wHTH) protein
VAGVSGNQYDVALLRVIENERPCPRVLISFGPFKLVPGERLLERAGSAVHLGARALDILITLTALAGDVVSKQDLIAHVWPDVTVGEGSLRFHVASLRKALGDGQSGGRYIATLPGRGYCFVAPVARSSPQASSTVPSLVPCQPHNLPTHLIRMVGRECAVHEISNRLLAERFVTILGPGGIGKTTIAISIGHRQLDRFRGAVRFFDLGSLNDPALVPGSVASTLGLLIRSGDASTGLISFLRNKRMLLIFDSCEHLIGAVASLVECIVIQAPEIHVLATSREALRVEGEHMHQLSPLNSPPDHADGTTEQALAFPAVQLFVDRATASCPGFVLLDADAPLVGEICRKLDGIALAIELAAGQVATYDLPQIAAFIGNQFQFLWRGRRTARPRHQTLSAVLDWSYELLDEVERLIMGRLSIFVGFFTLEASRAVASGGDIDAAQIVIGIGSLVEKSLISVDTGHDTTQYRLLDTTRVYAAERRARGSDAHETSHRHATYFCDVINASAADLPVLSDARRLERYGHHLGNVRAALAWSILESCDIELAAALAAAAGRLFLGLSLCAECEHWTRITISALDDTIRGTRLEMELQATLGQSSMFTKGNTEEARLAFMRALELAEIFGDSSNQLRQLVGLQVFHGRSGRTSSALTFAERGVAVATALGSDIGIAAAHSSLGLCHHLMGNQAAARSHLRLSLRSAPGGASTSSLNLGFDYRNRSRITLARIMWLEGYPEQALRLARQSVQEAAELGDAVTLCVALTLAMPLFLWTAEWIFAEEHVEGLIAHAEKHSLTPYYVYGLGERAGLLIRRGKAEVGVQLLRTALDSLREFQYHMLILPLASTLAEGLAAIGQPNEALRIIDDTIVLAERNGDYLNMPEFLRIKGDILASAPEADQSQAEVHLVRSRELAGRQAALVWELRAATSLARVWSKHRRPNDARNTLASVYARFTEGFEYADLAAAKDLLDDLDRCSLARRSMGI